MCFGTKLSGTLRLTKSGGNSSNSGHNSLGTSMSTSANPNHSPLYKSWGSTLAAASGLPGKPRVLVLVAVLPRRVDFAVLDHERNKVLANELEIVVARVEPDHRHLVDPFQDLLALRLRDAVNVWKPELVYHIRSDCLVTPLQGLVEALDQLSRVPGDDVLGLWV